MSSDDDVSSGDLSSDDGRSNGFEEEEEEEEEGEEGEEGFVVDDARSLVTSRSSSLSSSSGLSSSSSRSRSSSRSSRERNRRGRRFFPPW